MLEYKPDYDEAKERIDAFWNGEVIDRALTYIQFSRPEKECIDPPPEPDDPRDQTLDAEYRAEAALARAHNTVWYADAIPVNQPTLGPATVAGYFGAELEFNENTSWAKHDMDTWPDDPTSALRFSEDNFYFKKTIEITRAMRDIGEGKFITGIQEWLSPADILSALRGPDQFCIDLMECPERIQKVSAQMSEDLLSIYDRFYTMAREAGEPASNWLNLVSDDRYLVIQNDVSALLSPSMFESFLLPYTRKECKHTDHTMYHLDGLQALKDLDMLLEIPELDAVQWGPPPQRWDWHEWIDVYKRIQDAGKGFFLPIEPDDVHDLQDSGIGPEGAWVIVDGVSHKEEADEVLRVIEKWTG